MEKHKGLSGVDITTVGFLSQPEQAFAITDNLNREALANNPMKIELMHPLDTPANRSAQRVLSFLPQPYNAKDIKKFQHEYPDSKISHVHLPFRANQQDTWRGFASYVLERDPRELVLHAAFLGLFGTAGNRKGIDLAENLQVGINAHANVIEFFGQTGKLEDIKQRVPFVFVESTKPGPTYLVSQAEMSDPTLVAKRAERFKLSGMIFGLDHFQETDDIDRLDEVLHDEGVRRTIQRVHIANPDHGHLDVNDQNFTHLLHKLRDSRFSHPVRAILDMREAALSQVCNVRDYILQITDHIMQHAS